MTKKKARSPIPRPPVEEIRKRRAYVREQYLKRVPVAEIREAMMDPDGEFKLTERQAVGDINYLQKNWQEMREQDLADRTSVNIATAEWLLAKAMDDSNVKEARQCLELLCKLQNSFPERLGEGAVRDLISLAAEAAKENLAPRTAEIVPPEVLEEPKPQPPQPKPKPTSTPQPTTGPKLDQEASTSDGSDPDRIPIRPRGPATMSPAMRVNQEDFEKVKKMDPAEVQALVDGRVEPSNAVIEDIPGGPTRVRGGG